MIFNLHSIFQLDLFCTILRGLAKLLSTCLILCVSQYITSQDMVKIVVNPNENPYGEYKLSDLAESIEYIPLETNEKCLIGFISFFDISENYIVICDGRARKVCLFNRKGRFISEISSYGNGPGDYLIITGLFIDEKRNRIIIITGSYESKQLYYDLEGKFISYTSMKVNSGNYQIFHNDHFFLTSVNYNGNVPFAYEIRDIDFQFISENIKTVSFERLKGQSFRPTSALHYLYKDKIHTKETTLNDTIYSIENDFSYKPKYVVNAGKYEITTNVRTRGDFSGHVLFSDLFEADGKLFISYTFENEKFSYYDNNSRKLLYFKSKKGIPNDYDGGFDFWPVKQNNQYLYKFYDAYLFEDELKEKKKDTLKGSSQSIQSFNKLIKELDSEDNPVLMIVKIKE